MKKTLHFVINFNTNKLKKKLTQKINIISWEKKLISGIKENDFHCIQFFLHFQQKLFCWLECSLIPPENSQFFNFEVLIQPQNLKIFC